MNARPILNLTGVDFDRSYFTWQWTAPEVTDERVFVIEAAERDAVLRLLADAVPGERPGESERDMLTRVLGSGALADPVAELDLATRLAEVLLPAELAAEIVSTVERDGGAPIQLRLRLSPSTADVPWELLPLTMSDGSERRLIELADIAWEVPGGIHVGRARAPHPDAESEGGSVLYIVDPANRASSPVLDDAAHDVFRAVVADRGHERSTVNGEFTRRDLNLALTEQPPSRLFYIGHVIQDPTVAGSSSLLLSDPDDTFGVAPVHQDVSRPLSALDLFEGTQNWERRLQQIADENKAQAGRRRELRWPISRETRRVGARIWPAPRRVALVACKSGSDLGHTEPFGLAIAFINAGAELVTGTKWTLPTDHAYRQLVRASTRPMESAARVVDDAHASADPVAAIAVWQRERLAAWRSPERTHADAPLMWASFSTFLGEERVVESVLPVTESIRLVTG